VDVCKTQEWTDERLSWTPALHNNMTEIIVEARELWKPELAVINGSAVSLCLSRGFTLK